MRQREKNLNSFTEELVAILGLRFYHLKIAWNCLLCSLYQKIVEWVEWEEISKSIQSHPCHWQGHLGVFQIAPSPSVHPGRAHFQDGAATTAMELENNLSFETQGEIRKTF